MDIVSLASFVYVLNITLSCIACATFFIFNPLRLEREHKVVIHYFVALFGLMTAAFFIYIIRPLIPTITSIALSNIFYALAIHCLRYGLLWRKYQTAIHVYQDKWVYLHLMYLTWSNCYLFYLVYDSLALRAINTLINAFALFILCIPHIAKNKSQVIKGERKAKYLFLLLGVLNLIIVIPYAITQQEFIYTSSLLVLLTIQNITLLGALLTLLLSDTIEKHYKNSVTDALTELYNRRFFMERASSLIKSAQRHQFPMSLIMCDIDDFKQVNDNHGHDAGDKVLTVFSHTIRELTREDDLLARFGGEEFIILLPMTSIAGAQKLAQRMCLATENIKVMHENVTITITASFGVATFKSNDELEQNIRAADEALYQAKADGKNRVKAYQFKASA